MENNGIGLADQESTVDSSNAATTSRPLPDETNSLTERVAQIDLTPESGRTPKKKKKKRTKAQQRAPDGFGSDYEEEITPEMAEEELKMYDM